MAYQRTCFMWKILKGVKIVACINTILSELKIGNKSEKNDATACKIIILASIMYYTNIKNFK